jgi:hypothetical protein
MITRGDEGRGRGHGHGVGVHRIRQLWWTAGPASRYWQFCRAFEAEIVAAKG